MESKETAAATDRPDSRREDGVMVRHDRERLAHAAVLMSSMVEWRI